MDFFIQHFQETLIILLLLALFFKESLAEFINAKLGLTEKKEKVPQWGQRLTQYANHETTDRLNKLIEMEEKEHIDADIMRETMKDMSKMLMEFKEYGIRIRKD